jgi:hypothetical protein
MPIVLSKAVAKSATETPDTAIEREVETVKEVLAAVAGPAQN